LETADKIVGISDHVGTSPKLFLYYFFEPEVKNIMKIDIGKYGGYHSALCKLFSHPTPCPSSAFLAWLSLVQHARCRKRQGLPGCYQFSILTCRALRPRSANAVSPITPALMLPSVCVTTSAFLDDFFGAQSLQLMLSASYFAALRLKFTVTYKPPKASYGAVG